MKNWGWGKRKQAFFYFFRRQKRSECQCSLNFVTAESRNFSTLSVSAFALLHYVCMHLVLPNWRSSSHLTWNFTFPGTSTYKKAISLFSLTVCLCESVCRETRNSFWYLKLSMVFFPFIRFRRRCLDLV